MLHQRWVNTCLATLQICVISVLPRSVHGSIRRRENVLVYGDGQERIYAAFSVKGRKITWFPIACGCDWICYATLRSLDGLGAP